MSSVICAGFERPFSISIVIRFKSLNGVLRLDALRVSSVLCTVVSVVDSSFSDFSLDISIGFSYLYEIVIKIGYGKSIEV